MRLYLTIFTFFLLINCKSDKNNSAPHTPVKSKTFTKIDALAMVSEIYDTYQNSEEFLIKGLFYPANLLSQDFKLWGKTRASYASFELSPDNDDLNTFWTLSYEGIEKANKAIISLDSMLKDKIITPKLATRLKAECYFNRGLLYFFLASNFGNVPLVNSTDEISAINKPTSSQKDVFTWVIQDFTKAVEVLPYSFASKFDIGRATKGAALAYLGETYLWLKDYKKAIEAFNKLEGHYELMSNFLDIHAFKYQNNKESIFEIQFNGNDNLGWGRDNYSTFIQSFALPTEVGGTALAYINPVFVKSFKQKDTRRKATAIGPGQIHPDNSINISSYNSVQEQFNGINTLGTKNKPWLGDNSKRSGYYTVKNWRAPDPSATASAVFSKANVILMRYGQIILDLAEAKFKIGDVKGAQILINKVRKRAHLKPVYPKNIMPVLLNEYRHELAGEYSLWQILRRSGEYENYMQKHFNIHIPPGHDLLPIPQEQLQLNKALKQNKGY